MYFPDLRFYAADQFLCHCSLQEADNDPTGEAAANTQQTLTFYELDLGLNHVVRKYSEPLEEHGNFLITGTFLSELLCIPFYLVHFMPKPNRFYLKGLGINPFVVNLNTLSIFWTGQKFMWWSDFKKCWG